MEKNENTETDFNEVQIFAYYYFALIMSKYLLNFLINSNVVHAFFDVKIYLKL